jgi:hypothetical protein
MTIYVIGLLAGSLLRGKWSLMDWIAIICALIVGAPGKPYRVSLIMSNSDTIASN